jgi:hypothetical protein
MDGEFNTGEVLREAFEVVRRSFLPSVVFVVALTGLYSALDSAGSTAPQTFIGVATGYALLVTMLKHAGFQMPRAGQRFGAYFGLSLLFGLGVLVGLLLLVIPGLILFIRWLPSYVILLTEDEKVTRSLGESWDRTKGHAWPLAFACLASVGVAVAAGFAAAFVSDALSQPLVVTIGSNLVATGWIVFYTALGIAAYRLLSGNRRELGEVFA